MEVTFTKAAGRRYLMARREARRPPSAGEHAEMGRSEDLARVCLPLWELRAGHRRELPDWFGMVPQELVRSPLCERILARLDGFAARWHPLPAGGSISLTWPLDRLGRPVARRPGAA